MLSDTAPTQGWNFRHRAFGEVQDPNTGWIYLRARWMDPGTGRFASRDPFGGDPERPISLQRYLYTELRPIDLADPGGEQPISINAQSFAAEGYALFADARQALDKGAQRAQREQRSDAATTVAIINAPGEISGCAVRCDGDGGYKVYPDDCGKHKGADIAPNFDCKVGACWVKHEEMHIQFLKLTKSKNLCKNGQQNLKKNARLAYPAGYPFYTSEDYAFQKSLKCAKDYQSAWAAKVKKTGCGFYNSDPGKKNCHCKTECSNLVKTFSGGWKNEPIYADLPGKKYKGP